MSQFSADIEITIQNGKEYQCHEEDIYQSNAFFFQSYCQAGRCVEEILQVAKQYMTDHPLTSASDEEINDRLRGYPNNVIAFCAQRGQGKTSAMVSFATALKQLREGQNKEKWTKIHSNKSLTPQYRFEVINSIDPSSMGERESILAVILSRLFTRFQGYWDQQYPCRFAMQDQDEKLNQQRTILQYFQKCFRNLHVPDKTDFYEDDALEHMIELGDSGNLRGALYRLICAFLNFIHGTEDSYLVLQIDDADLSLSGAFQLIDQIRRNLVMPRVIILLAANMFQLESTVEQHFIQQYQTSIQLHGMVDVETCHSIATRYMDKVIPGARQICLPDLGKLFGSEFNHIRINYIKEGKNCLDDGESLYYQDQLLRYLHQRTGLVLLNPQNHLHNLLPRNMRELTHFFPYFRDLSPLSIGYQNLIDYFAAPETTDLEAIDIWLYNLEQFKRYLVDAWAPVNLRTEGHEFLRSLMRYEDATIHRHVLNFLPDYYASERSQSGIVRGISVLSKSDYRQEFIDQCSARGLRCYPLQQPFHSRASQYATYVDVMEALNVLSELPGALRQYKFIYAIRLYYTIRMHQLMLEGFLNQKDSELSTFLGDMLWQRKGQLTDDVYFAHYSLPLKTLVDCLTCLNSNGIVQQSATTVSMFCRKVAKSKYFYTVPCPSLNLPTAQEETDTLLCFHIFYPCFHDLEILLKGPRNSNPLDRDEAKDQNLQKRILGAMILMLNWDVQYVLSKSFLKTSEEADPGLLFNYVRGAYGGNAMEQTFACIQSSTGRNWDSSLYQSYYDASFPQNKQILDAIQFCIPELRHQILSYCSAQIKKLLSELANLPESIRNSDRSLSQALSEEADYQTFLRNLSNSAMIQDYLDKFCKFFQKPAHSAAVRKFPDMTYSNLEGYLNYYTKLLDNDFLSDVSTDGQEQPVDTGPAEKIHAQTADGNPEQLLEQLRNIFSHAVIVKVDSPHPSQEART